jgi:VWFA-related protein
MIRILASVLTVASAAAVVAGPSTSLRARQEQPSTFRAGSALVRAFVTVTDKTGKIATTLGKGDFELRDEGKPQEITLFDNSPRPIRLIVMLDVSGSMLGNLPLLQNGTTELVRQLRREDAMRVGTFGNEVTIGPAFTRDPKELLAALPSAIDRNAPTPLWRAVEKAIDAFGPSEGDARDVVLVLTDGKDSGFSLKEKFVTAGDVIERARRQDVMIYAVGMRNRRASLSGGLSAALAADDPDPGLARVAAESGGGYTEVDYGYNVGAAFAQVAEELHSQYLLGFAPPKRDGKVHDIEIKVKQPDMKPRARKSYVAPKN